MAEILYYDYPTVTECTAQVVSCEEKDGKYLVALDRTMIFPEGGGQLPDGGTIEGAKVCAKILDCRTADGEVIHYCDKPFAPGEKVRVVLDLPRRLDHCEQHTGEHMLSGLASKLFGAKNVGFHMAEDYCTIDLDIPLMPEQLEALELAANEAVRADRPVHTEVTDEADALSRTLRKRAEKAQGEVRIVYIDNGKIDSCTCCGTHLPRTGMVGAVRITDAQHYKGGTRLWFACGDRAAKAAIAEHNAVTALARQYSTSREELPKVVKKQMDELASAKAELKQKSILLAEKTAEELLKKASAERPGRTAVICGLLPGMNANDLRLICDSLAAKKDARWTALLFAPSAAGTDYHMACSAGCRLSMKELCAAVNAAVNGKGGGGPLFAQGKTERQADEDIAAMLKNYIEKAVD
jgi:Predicted metal-dependent hydrolases related to alanyl-tRNA synthetase HxxxH domain